MGFFNRNLLQPIFVRVGTLLGGALAGYGVAASDVELIVAAVPAVLGLLVDEGRDRVFKK